ncbi:hypothetical protein [Bacillus infantis]|uniref:hypothetical protein n=1 Tax=Bacillus infantis TaxID=324767 RepID=UPI003CF6C8C6
MSLKLIEMQVALPRMQDASKIQEQLQQRGQMMNDLAARAVQKQEEKDRKSVVKKHSRLQAGWQKERSPNSGGSMPEKEKEEKDEIVKEVHPYKGTSIDYRR